MMYVSVKVINLKNNQICITSTSPMDGIFVTDFNNTFSFYELIMWCIWLYMYSSAFLWQIARFQSVCISNAPHRESAFRIFIHYLAIFIFLTQTPLWHSSPIYLPSPLVQRVNWCRQCPTNTRGPRQKMSRRTKYMPAIFNIGNASPAFSAIGRGRKESGWMPACVVRGDGLTGAYLAVP